MAVGSLPSWVFFVAVLLILAAPVWVWSAIVGMHHRRFRRQIQSRPDHSMRWQTEFPNDMPTADRVLAIFCDAFIFDEQHKYKFVPEDAVAVIYENTTGPIGDELQCEQLVAEIEQAFGVDLTERDWGERLTLGEIVHHVIEVRETGQRGPAGQYYG